MSNIIVAGAGHGGLIAAARLSAAGHNVTVFEKKQKDELGYPWQDRFTFSLLTDALGITEDELPKNSWTYRGDCDFVSPSKNKHVVIRYTEETRQRIMWRKPLLQLLLEHAENCGVDIKFGTPVAGALIDGNTVTGIYTSATEYKADLVIDAAGVFSPVRCTLPKYFNIETEPKRGDLFYAYRAYYHNELKVVPETPFEIYLRHNGELGLSWVNSEEEYADILLGRIDPLSDEQINALLDDFRSAHPWIGKTVLYGGQKDYIPVRRPLTLMVANGYAAVGNSAFMTTPMNGMGIDLAIEAGGLLADNVLHANGNYRAEVLWEYNRDFHMLYGAESSRNAGLKNAILRLPKEGVDFLFEQDVIQASDLSGAGRNTSLLSLLGKFTRGMKRPPYFTALLKGLIKGGKAASLYHKPPARYDIKEILMWSNKIASFDIFV